MSEGKNSFDITIKNAILDPKHYEAMGKAVWLYMLLLDKTTKVDSEGRGIVLGGKPLTYEDDIKPIFPITRQTYYKWVVQLEDYPYIKTTRTPRGISFRVMKAHKYFGNRRKENLTSLGNRDVKKNYSDVKKSLQRSKQNLTSNKTIQDNTKTIGLNKSFENNKGTNSETKNKMRELKEKGLSFAEIAKRI